MNWRLAGRSHGPIDAASPCEDSRNTVQMAQCGTSRNTIP
jgi:hypothetical protein